MQKLFFSLLSLLSSLVGLYGVMRLGWHWEMAVPGALTLLFLGLALVSGNRTTVELLDECDDDELEETWQQGAASVAARAGRADLAQEESGAVDGSARGVRLDEERPVLASLASPVPAVRRGKHHTQRLEWGQVEELLRSVDGPTRF